jgi:serine/threonine protein kinase
MNLYETDFKNLMVQGVVFDDQHIITLMYNILCSLSFLHSANVMHRDIKPSNFLVNTDSSVAICDFGLSRAMSDTTDEDEEIKKVRKRYFKKLRNYK